MPSEIDNDEQISDLLAELEGLALNQGAALNIKVVSNKGSALAKILGSEDESQPLETQNRWYALKLKVPLFIRRITIDVEGYNDKRPFELEWQSIRKVTRNTKSAKVSNGSVLWRVADVVNEIRIKPPKKFLGTAYIQTLTIWGMTLPQLEDSIAKVGRMEEIRQSISEWAKSQCDEVEAAEERLSELNSLQEQASSLISETEAKLAETEGSSDEASNALAGKKKELELAKQTLSELTAKATQQESEISQKKEDISDLNSRVSKKTSELRKLERDINKFPSEISGLVDQGTHAAKRYLMLALIPIALIGFLGYDVYSRAENLLAITPGSDVSIWEQLILRLPYVLIVGSITGVAFKLAMFFAQQLIKIYDQRMNLAKISIVATDVSVSACEDLEISDAEKVEHNTYLRMSLLREHLKHYISENYRYQKRKEADSSSSTFDNESTDVADEESVDEESEQQR